MSKRKKECKRCHSIKSIDSFYVHKMMADGHLSFCKECVKKRVRGHYQRTLPERHAYEKKRNQTPERKEDLRRNSHNMRVRWPEKQKARSALNNAVRDGKIKREPCRVCGEPKSQGHHKDYSKPLDVEWLCFKCHMEQEHGKTVTTKRRW